MPPAYRSLLRSHASPLQTVIKCGLVRVVLCGGCVLQHPAQDSVSEHPTTTGSAKIPCLCNQEPAVCIHNVQEYYGESPIIMND